MVTQRTLGASINSIISYGGEDIINCAVDTGKNILFYVFVAALLPVNNGGTGVVDTIYFAAPDINGVDQVFGKVMGQGRAGSAIEHGICPRPGKTDEFYFIYKTRALSNTPDDVRYCIVNSTNKTVSAPVSIITNESNGEGMAISGLNCSGNNRWLYTSEILSGGNVNIRRSEINAAGISNTTDIYTITIPGNAGSVVQGGLEISNNNDKLAICNYNGSGVTKDAILFDLNLTTGLISNERSYDNPSYPLVNCEFSPDGTRLYLLQAGSSSFPNAVYNVPAIATGTLALNASYQMTPTIKGTLQLEKAHNGKLYVHLGHNRDSLLVISTPNSAALGMTYTTGSFYSGAARLGPGYPDQLDGELFWTMAPLSSSVSTGGSSCGTNSGTATVSASGGSGFFTYSWSTGQTTAGITGLSSGTYTVTVRSNSCVAVHTVNIVQSGPQVTLASFANVLCNGGATGAASVSASSGTSPYTYSWNNAQTTALATGLSAGTYTVTVTDAGGCTSTITTSITQPAALGLSATGIDPLCFGGSGSATSTATGGAGSYTYSWSNGQTTQSATGLAVGGYTLQVTDVNGCTMTQTVNITQPASISLGASSVNTNCGQSNGSLFSAASGGTGTLIYIWSPGGATTSSVTGVAAGSYTITVTDGNGCTKTASATVGGSIGPQPNITSNVSPLCNGATNGSAAISVSGGTGTYTYSWNNGQTTSSATGLSAGIYTVTVTDSVGCQSVRTVAITQPAAVVGSTSTLNTNCNAFTGLASVTASGGTGPYTYTWSNGSTTQVATGLSAGTYTVLITDINGCTQTVSTTVSQFASPSVSAGLNVTITQGSSTVLNGSGGVTYTWSPSSGLSCTNCQNPIASPSVTTTYTLIVTDNNGCTGVAVVTIIVDIPCKSGELFVPSAFSPNGDSKNDILFVRADCYKTFVFRVFDRWGEKVFETQDPSVGWDGKFNGKLFSTAVFVYHLHVITLDDKEVDKRGNVTLMR